MKNIKKTIIKLLRDESGQGATEYILILVAVVAVAVIFKDQLMKVMTDKLMPALQGKIDGFMGP
ncbi:MAG: hypothetical protein A2Z20_05490 [Bdellovibrionales bacterium RBG_16_40_8]|nr:MAG: hypothetical protein A2Z20_05490 [Bdellovibrionales bacterium RBG_16_40_8]